MNIAVLDKSGQSTGKEVALSADVFGIEPNDHAIYLDVKRYMAEKRQGTHKAKERNEVAGSTRKIKKQKGTGTARAGDIKSPVFRGGGRIFGPRPRTYDIKLNKKVKALARMSALTYKAKDNNIVVMNELSFDAPKTKEMAGVLNNIECGAKKVLFLVDNLDKNMYLSSRNMPNTCVRTIFDIETYQVLHADKVVFVGDAHQSLTNFFVGSEEN